jgi:hypothetical protein
MTDLIYKLRKKFLNEPSFLPSRMFGDPNDTSYSWEDYRRDTKANHPIWWFLLDTLPHLFAVKITMRLENLWYWIRTHTYNKYHLLDLRQTENRGGEAYYRWGYLDPCTALVLANFKVLERYIQEEPFDLRTQYSEEEIDEQGLRSQQDHYDEVMKIYNYWIKGRLEHWKTLELQSQVLHRFRKSNYKKYLVLLNEYDKNVEAFHQEEEEYLIRLIKVRRGLWT